MTIFPFIIFKKRVYKQDAVLINHERIHIKQQLELLIFPFYLFYGTNYLINRLKKQDHYTAYRNIMFEKEAFTNEANFAYLKNRKLFAWLKYTK